MQVQVTGLCALQWCEDVLSLGCQPPVDTVCSLVCHEDRAIMHCLASRRVLLLITERGADPCHVEKLVPDFEQEYRGESLR